MARKFNAGEDQKRTDLFGFDPKALILEERDRGRRFPPTEQEILEMAESIYDNGQEQPIKVRRAENNRLKVVAGFTRCAAGRLIRDGFTGLDGVARQNKDFLLQCVISTMNDEDALVANIVENAHRKSTSPIDDAYNHQRLRDQCMKSDADIARLYKYKSQNRVSRLKKFLSLPLKYQQMLHESKLTEEAALDLLELPEDKREAVVAEAIKESEGNGNGKVDGSVVRTMVREEHLRDDDESIRNLPAPKYPVEKPKFKARTIRELKVFFTGIAEDEEGNEAVVRFAKDTLEYISGKKSDKAMNNAIQRLLEAKA